MNKIETGLKIALILFVVIAIILGVTTIIFKKQRDEAYLERDAAKKSAEVAKDEKTKVSADIVELKQMIGYADDSVAGIRVKFEEEMKRVAPQAEKPTYVSVVGSFLDQIRSLNEKNTQKDKLLATLSGTYETRNKDTIALRGTIETESKQRKEEIKKLAKRMDDELKKTSEDSKSAIGKSATAVAKLTAERKALEEREEEAIRRLGNEKDKVKVLAERLDERDNPRMDSPQGKITFVAPNGTRGQIDLGSDSNVKRGQTFSVYNASDISEQGRKGSIEVVDITNARSSEVRILNASMDAPVSEGDVILNPAWSRGYQERFILVGIINADNSGRNDIERVKNSITKNGGVVDAWQREDGTQVGKITSDASFVVVGIRPTENSTEVFRNTYTNMLTEANKHSIPQKPLKTLLKEIAYEPPKLDRGAAVAEKADSRTISSGKVSDVFSNNPAGSRRAPAGSAY